jgi:mono/diheme cytochrome c family protein
MKKIFKWIGIVLGSLVGLILVLAAVFYFIGNSRLNQTYDFPPDDITVPTDAASLARGEHWTKMHCTGCHGADLGGVTNWFPPGPFGSMDSANLTSGNGGIGQEYTSDEEYVLAIRHGVGPEGKPIYMPAVVALSSMSDEDLGALIAYLKTVPPVDRQTAGQKFSALGKILIGAGLFGKLPVEQVSHTAHITAPEQGVTVEYGQYLVNTGGCKDCHGEQLSGGPHPDPTVKIISPNLTPGGELVAWTDRDFIAAMRTGVTLSGHAMNPEYMPWKEIGLATNDELKAMFIYLQSLPKLEQVMK